MTAALASLSLFLAIAAADPPFIDSAIAGVTLGDHVSGEAFVTRHGGVPDEPEDDFPRFQFTNDTQTELLQLLMHYGDLRHSFNQFRVRLVTDSAPPGSISAQVSEFVTGKGIRLGLSVAEVVAALGEPHERQVDGTTLRLTYRCNARARCPALASGNMPQYEARYLFVEDALTAFEGGYPYP